MRVPGLPVLGSIGVSPPPGTLSSATYSVRRSYAGTTCWGSCGAGNRSTTRKVAGSITVTSSLPFSGTYTSVLAPATAGLYRFAAAAAYTLLLDSGGGIPASSPVHGGE